MNNAAAVFAKRSFETKKFLMLKVSPITSRYEGPIEIETLKAGI